MKARLICVFLKIRWSFLLLILFFVNACAELDGIFPKYRPQKNEEKTEDLPTSASVVQKQMLLSEENVYLQKKIEKLQNQIIDLQKKQKEQRDDFLVLQEQWEMNFVLLERSVEESLRSPNSNKKIEELLIEKIKNN